MSIGLAIQINDYATPGIDAKLQRTEPKRVAEICRPRAEAFWRDRLKSLGPNKRGWPTTKFYERAADSVTGRVEGDALVLTADHQGLRQRWQGGVITPRRAGALTIPISPISYGKSAHEFPDLFLIKTVKGAYLVRYTNTVTANGGTKFAHAEDRRVASRRKKRGLVSRAKSTLEFLFKLSKGVKQDGNPDVVPTNDEFAEVLLPRIEEAIRD